MGDTAKITCIYHSVKFWLQNDSASIIVQGCGGQVVCFGVLYFLQSCLQTFLFMSKNGIQCVSVIEFAL